MAIQDLFDKISYILQNIPLNIFDYFFKKELTFLSSPPPANLTAGVYILGLRGYFSQFRMTATRNIVAIPFILFTYCHASFFCSAVVASDTIRYSAHAPTARTNNKATPMLIHEFIFFTSSLRRIKAKRYAPLSLTL